MTYQLPLLGSKCKVENCRALVTVTVTTSSGYRLEVCDGCARSLTSMGWRLA